MFICSSCGFQIRLSQTQEAVDISQAMQQLFEGPEDRWPYIDSTNFMGDVLFADQPKIDLQVLFCRCMKCFDGL